jgi:hypothetical protein
MATIRLKTMISKSSLSQSVLKKGSDPLDLARILHVFLLSRHSPNRGSDPFFNTLSGKEYEPIDDCWRLGKLKGAGKTT